MVHQSSEDRRKARESAYFHNQDKELLRRLAEAEAMKRRRDELFNQTGIEDQELLDRMLDWQIEPEALEVLLLVPLVEIAWANGRVDEGSGKPCWSLPARKGCRRIRLAISCCETG